MRTQVGIVGAGPAGLLLGHLLHLAGIATMVVERHSRAEVEGIIRAGVLEQATVDLLQQIGVGARMRRDGLRHHGIVLRHGGRDTRIDFDRLAGGRGVTIYAQHDLNKDLIQARIDGGAALVFGAAVTGIDGADSDRPSIRFRDGAGAEHELACDFVAGCDGSHGVCRASIADGALRRFEHAFPHGWLGILCRAPRSSEELIYCLHERGFALVSTRSPQVQRLYLQCDPADSVDAWSDERIWTELRARLATVDGWTLQQGPIFDKTVIAMRSVVVEPMRHGRLFLAGDAAHIVPPTGAKGLNLAVNDARLLARAFTGFYRSGRQEALDAYSDTALRRVWQATRFSNWMTSLLHRRPQDDDFQRRLQLAELDHLTGSDAASAALAQDYVGPAFG